MDANSFSLIPCRGCSRHIRSTESACPFCAEAVEVSELAAEMSSTPRLDRSRLVALSSLLATSGMTLSGCDPVPAPVYGGPPIVAPAPTAASASPPSSASTKPSPAVTAVPSGSGASPSASSTTAPSSSGVAPVPPPAPEPSQRLVKPVYGGPPIRREAPSRPRSDK